ncbi:TetR/AcrR family transcriptional regulator [Desulfolutivibrio sulfoxidireducens]|uniref:TetR/AcrR family transcriptional regulator n=1 Tax=Desulfolutivibrio sulfoxidireducens TaxID=2773299 RepID=UPI00159E24E7|nr:TetR/AcrR family transcriptional regulator [Desulfolutivibrio sulfoxidireducens]QLA15392.1 TetR family transcriptional regulator [Desulfolutivibrio sulfoxidireducens]
MPPTRRDLATAETRRLILEAAKDLYLEKGYRLAPTRELARRAGVAEGTVFAHFPDKASLLAAALHEDLELAIGEARATLPPGDAPCRERLLHLAGALYAYYAQNPGLSRALVKESLFLGGEWGGHVRDAVMRFIGLVGSLVEEAKARGEYALDVDAAVAGKTFFAAYYLELLGGLSGPGFDPLLVRNALEGHLRLWERGLLKH